MREQRAVLGAFRGKLAAALSGLVLVVGLSALRLSALVNDLGASASVTALYVCGRALAISGDGAAGHLRSVSADRRGLASPVIAAMKDLLHFQFGQFWLLAAVGLGLLRGLLPLFRIASCGWMRKAPGAVTGAVLGDDAGSSMIVVGLTTLNNVPARHDALSDFHILVCASVLP